MAAQPFAHTDLPSSLAFDLVTHYGLVHSERSEVNAVTNFTFDFVTHPTEHKSKKD